jgi:two-component system chemotaxis sensor kinase CheA
VLRLKDGLTEVSYAIQEAIDIVQLPDEIAPATGEGLVAGVALLDGEQIELLDAFAVFAEHGDSDELDDAPLCLLAGDGDGWMSSFVRPILETAGYRVVSELAPGERPAVVLGSDSAEPVRSVGAPLVRLRKRKAPAGPSDDSIYRYDRAGLLSALEARVAEYGGR